MGKVFLLGAGFTRSVTEGKAPLTDELMDKICDLIIPELAQDYENTYPNIELFITLLDIRMRQRNNKLREGIKEVYKNIVERIVSLIDVDSLRDDYPLCENFVKKVSQNDTIITLNYDCVLDKYLWLSGKWSPNGGYGFPLFPGTKIKKNVELDNILLLKIHGSCNFRNFNFRNNSGNNDYPNIEINEDIFPGINSYLNNRDSKLDKGPHVLIMSYLKQPSNQIREIWSEVLAQIEQSNRLIIIGCSLREEDEFLKFALYHFGTSRAKSNNFIVDIVDKNRQKGEEIKSRLKKKNLLVYPDKQKIIVYDGLQNYLDSYQPGNINSSYFLRE